MNNLEEFDEITKICCHACEMWDGERCALYEDCTTCYIATSTANELVLAGFRKDKNVAQEILNKLVAMISPQTYYQLREFIENQEQKYAIKVKK